MNAASTSGTISFKHVDLTRWLTVTNNQAQTIRIPDPYGPMRIELTTPANQTFHPSAADQRNLSAQVGFTFAPGKG